MNAYKFKLAYNSEANAGIDQPDHALVFAACFDQARDVFEREFPPAMGWKFSSVKVLCRDTGYAVIYPTAAVVAYPKVTDDETKQAWEKITQDFGPGSVTSMPFQYTVPDWETTKVLSLKQENARLRKELETARSIRAAQAEEDAAGMRFCTEMGVKSVRTLQKEFGIDPDKEQAMFGESQSPLKLADMRLVGSDGSASADGTFMRRETYRAAPSQGGGVVEFCYGETESLASVMVRNNADRVFAFERPGTTAVVYVNPGETYAEHGDVYRQVRQEAVKSLRLDSKPNTYVQRVVSNTAEDDCPGCDGGCYVCCSDRESDDGVQGILAQAVNNPPEQTQTESEADKWTPGNKWL